MEEGADSSEETTCQEFEAVYVIDGGGTISGSVVVKTEREDLDESPMCEDADTDQLMDFEDFKPDPKWNIGREKVVKIESEFTGLQGAGINQSPFTSGTEEGAESYLKIFNKGRKLKKNELLRCDRCGFTSFVKGALRKHIRSCDPSMHRRNCPCCAYASAEKREVHPQVKLTRQCPRCDFTCVQNSDLKAHIRSKHASALPHKCPHCDYSCAQSSTLRIHVLSKHSSERPHKCPHCDYSCVQNSTLKLHVLSKHTFERPHQCPHCEYSFVQSGSLKHHIQSKHTLERPQQCPHCDYSCVKGSSLKMHIQSKHTFELPHRCPDCDYTCINSSTLKRHTLAKHTSERPHQCPHCDYSCVQSGHLKRHMRSKHALK